MRVLKIAALGVALGGLAAPVLAQETPFVGDDQPGAELRFDKPTFASEPLCKSNRASASNCVFKTVLVEVARRLTFVAVRPSQDVPE